MIEVKLVNDRSEDSGVAFCCANRPNALFEIRCSTEDEIFLCKPCMKKLRFVLDLILKHN